MGWALLIAATLVCVEVALRSPLAASVSALTDTARKAAWIVRSPRISDHWKERALPRLAFRMFGASLKLLGSLVMILAPLLVALAAGSAAGWPMWDMVASLGGTLVLIVVAIPYVGLRRRFARV